MFDTYKPLRTILHQHDLWRGLGTTYRYLLYLQFSRLPDPLMTPKQRMCACQVAADYTCIWLNCCCGSFCSTQRIAGAGLFLRRVIAFRAIGVVH